jgi:UDP-N-acetylmuramyl pentapeptide synthase
MLFSRHANAPIIGITGSNGKSSVTQLLGEMIANDGNRVRIFIFQNLTLGYMTKTLNQIIFFSLHQNQNIFFSNIGNH